MNKNTLGQREINVTKPHELSKKYAPHMQVKARVDYDSLFFRITIVCALAHVQILTLNTTQKNNVTVNFKITAISQLILTDPIWVLTL